MRKKIFWLIPVLLILIACTCSVPSIIPALKTPTASSPSGGGGPVTGTGFVTVQLNPGDGRLTMQLSSEVKKAAALGLKPFVEWDAEW